jgi:hypothetical protein
MRDADKRDAAIGQRCVMHRNVRERNDNGRGVAVVRVSDGRPNADADGVAFHGVLFNRQQSGLKGAVQIKTFARRVRDGVMNPSERQRRQAFGVNGNDDRRDGQRGRGRVQRVTRRDARNRAGRRNQRGRGLI